VSQKPGAIHYSIDASAWVISIRAEGTYTVGLLEKHIKRLLQDPMFESGMNSVFDLSGARPDLRCTAEQFPRYEAMRTFAAFLESVQHRRGAARIGIVAPDDLNYGIARMFCTMCEHIIGQRQVFRDRGCAEDWVRQRDGCEQE
jgi:hypothetical protein